MKRTQLYRSAAAIVVSLALGACVATRKEERPTPEEPAPAPVSQAEQPAVSPPIAEEPPAAEAPPAKVSLSDVLREVGDKIHFDTDSAELGPEAAAHLNRVGEVLAMNPAEKLRIDGFTDSTGTEGHNQQLSERRANSVSTILTSRGVQPEQIDISGHGESRPLATNRTDEGRAENRRVELKPEVTS